MRFITRKYKKISIIIIFLIKGEFMLHDADIREPLFDYLEDSYGKIRILEEVEIARSRADVIMVTDDSLVGLEIATQIHM